MSRFAWSAFVVCSLPAVAGAQPAARPPSATKPSPASPAPERPPTPPSSPGFGAGVAKRAVQQAGVGSGIAFASRGVLQLGGSAGLRAGSESTQLSFTPQIGWFIFNNIQISAILDVTHVATDLTDDVTSMTILAEPSYHYPLTDVVFVFAGIGLGAAWETDRGSALAASPRLGAELLIGRSGVLTPSLSWMGTTRDEMEQTTALRLNLGYSVMW